MANQTCQGCQSFCMLGKQIVSDKDVEGKNIVHKKQSHYPTSWTSWKDIVGKSDLKDSNKEEDIIYRKITADIQNDLIAYIQAAWEEGDVNLSQIATNVKEWNNKHPNGVNGHIPSAGSTKSYESTNVANAKMDGHDGVIYNYHYNRLGNILGESTSGITSDLKGDIVTGNPTEAPVVGSFTDRDIEDNKLVKKDDLIYASQYRKLYERASKLMYHPYQCNICNIYEGGEWLEIVKETKKALAKYISDNGFTAGDKMSDTSQYSWVSGADITVQGINAHMGRRDCSGFVGTCLYIYGKASDIDVNPALCSWSTAYGFDDNTMEKLGFTPKAVSEGVKKGDIKLNRTTHVEIAAEDGGTIVYNCGSNSSASASGTTSSGYSNNFFDILFSAP